MFPEEVMDILKIAKLLAIQENIHRHTIGIDQFQVFIQQKLRHTGICKSILLHDHAGRHQTIGKDQI